MNKKLVSFVCIVLVAVMLLGLVATGFSAFGYDEGTQGTTVEDLEVQKGDVNARQKLLLEQIEGLKSDRASIMDQKAMLDEQNELIRQGIVLIDEQLALYAELIEQKAIELEDAQEAEALQYERYSRRVRLMEENDTWSYLTFIFQATSFSDLLARVDDVMDIMGRDQQVAEKYRAAKEAAAQTKSEYEDMVEKQELVKAELEQQQEALDGQIETASALITDLESDIDTYVTLYEEAEADMASVQSRIDAMVAEIERQNAAAAASAVTGGSEKQDVDVTGSAGAVEAPAVEESKSEEPAVVTPEVTQSDSEAVDEPAAEEVPAEEPAETVTQPETTPEPEVSTDHQVSAPTGTYYQWPSYCTYISSLFGYRVHPIFQTTKYHSGVDIAAAYGTNITAAASGTVIIAESSSGYGNYVTIYHSNGTTTLYGHMSSIAVTSGQTVSAGDVIGYVGSTGYSTGPHLHFEVRVNGACVDPMQYFSGGSFTYAADA